MIRMPAVAGRFYEAKPERLLQEIETYILHGHPKEQAISAISPHAGYIYSGHVAGAVYSSIEIPPIVVILGPNHTGLGHPASIMVDGTWQMPLGPVEISSDLAYQILQNSSVLSEDVQAHLYEHSIEVQIPFLQYFNPTVRIVPICLSRLSLPEIEDIGQAIAQAVKYYPKQVLIVASTDMSHYVPLDLAKKKDALAIERILELDYIGLLEVVSRENISMCGVIPTAVTLVASKLLGASKGYLVRYATSGEISGDFYQVVGYAGLIIS